MANALPECKKCSFKPLPGWLQLWVGLVVVWVVQCWYKSSQFKGLAVGYWQMTGNQLAQGN